MTEPPPHEATAAAHAPPSARPLRVLVVDDCEANARLATVLLAKLGAIAVSASSGREALDTLTHECFDAVLMDCGLPDIDGYEATSRIRRGEAGADRSRIPIVAFTADSDSATMERCRDAGMEHVLAKPIEPARLRALLGELSGGGDRTGANEQRSPASDQASAQAFDALGLLERVLYDESLARDVVEAFLGDLGGQIDRLRRAIEESACQRSASLAHQLKGAAGGVGGVALRQLANDIEAASYAGDTNAMRQLIAALNGSAAAFRRAVESTDLGALASASAPRSPNIAPAPVRDCRLLIVEDDPTLRSMLERMAQRDGCRITTAESAESAKRAVESAGPLAFDCIVTDYRMPGETGLDLLTWIRGRDPHLAVIVMTADDERSIVANSLRKGACEFLEKPIDARRLTNAVSSAMSRTRERRHLAHAQSEVAAVGSAQARLLDNHRDPNFPVEVVHKPKHDAGGDFCSQFALGPNRSFLLLTDVSGHDIQAAYLSAFFHGLSRGMLSCGATPESLLSAFNEFLITDWNQAKTSIGSARAQASVAITSVLLDREAGAIDTVTAGAPAPARTYADGRIAVVGARGGSPLGWFDQAQIAHDRSTTDGGGSLILWSDGADELAQATGTCVLAVASALLAAQSRGERHPLLVEAGDDILVVRARLDGTASCEGLFWPIVLWRYRGDDSAQIDAMVEYWRRSLRLAVPQMPDQVEHDILLATREAMLNALHHGCGGDPSLRVALHISYRPASETIRVIVEDPGPGHGFDPAAYAERTAGELVTEHRGLMFIHFLATEVRSLRNGATIEMDFSLRR